MLPAVEAARCPKAAICSRERTHLSMPQTAIASIGSELLLKLRLPHLNEKLFFDLDDARAKIAA
jgi:hypothetical protein